MQSIDESRLLGAWLPTIWSDPTRAVATYPLDRSVWTPHLRLSIALRDSASEGLTLGGADVVSLVRGVARYHALFGGIGTGGLTIPRRVHDSAAPETWRAASVESDVASEAVRIKASAWYPSWLANAADLSPEDALYSTSPRRNDPSVRGDPLLQTMRMSQYRSVAQRDAVRTVLSASPGSTVVVDLPTGSGKSLCGFVPSIINGTNGDLPLGVTIIAVPTTALKLDMERRLREVVGHPVAYSHENRVEADEIRRRVAAGQQGPLIASPESLVGSLRGPLCKAAASGFLRYLVIDEAHMITAWGDEFRPAFQQLPGVRRELLRQSTGDTIITVLMSATFTEYTLRAMEEMFPPAHGGEFRLVHAVRLRPEPAYWNARAPTEEDREKWILDAIRHLPRPLILYALKRSEVLYWYQLLISKGFKRLGMIDGKTEDNRRRQLLEQWNRNRLDIMVATSAFGLGVDKSDVRAVVHASLPEGLDRLYQDVGRSGRDGRASVSLVVWHRNDWRAAMSIATPKFIGHERGRQRWHAMFFDPRKKVIDADTYGLRVSVPPSSTAGDIDMDNDENEKWNRRTLTLMARAGLLELVGSSVEGHAELNEWIIVKVLQGQLDRPAIWESLIEARRKELAEFYRTNNRALEEALSPNQCIAFILKRCYSSERYGINVVRACGGCQYCRSKSVPPSAGPLRARHTPFSPPPSRPLIEPVASWFGSAVSRYLYHTAGPSEEEICSEMSALFFWLAEGGVRNWVADPELLSQMRESPWAQSPGQAIFFHETLPADVTRLQPTVVIVRYPGAFWERIWRQLDQEGKPAISRTLTPTAFILPQDIRQPGRPDRIISQILNGRSLTSWSEEYLI